MSNTDSDGDPAATTEHPAFGALPAPRMEPYLNYVRGDQGRAIELYQWNIAVSAALWRCSVMWKWGCVTRSTLR